MEAGLGGGGAAAVIPSVPVRPGEVGGAAAAAGAASGLAEAAAALTTSYSRKRGRCDHDPKPRMKTGASGAARTRKRSLAFCGRGGKKATRPPSRKTNIKCPVALSGGEGVGGEGEGKGEPTGEKEEEKKPSNPWAVLGAGVEAASVCRCPPRPLSAPPAGAARSARLRRSAVMRAAAHPARDLAKKLTSKAAELV